MQQKGGDWQKERGAIQQESVPLDDDDIADYDYSDEDDDAEPDEDDAEPEDEQEEEEVVGGGTYLTVPYRYAWLSFLRYMGWLRAEVIGEQPDDYVYECWEVYQLEVKYGQLQRAPSIF